MSERVGVATAWDAGRWCTKCEILILVVLERGLYALLHSGIWFERSMSFEAICAPGRADPACAAIHRAGLIPQPKTARWTSLPVVLVPQQLLDAALQSLFIAGVDPAHRCILLGSSVCGIVWRIVGLRCWWKSVGLRGGRHSVGETLKLGCEMFVGLGQV